MIGGNRIELFFGVGYCLVIGDEKVLCEVFLDDLIGRVNMNIVLMFVEDRVDYIIWYLLFKNDYVKLEILLEEFFVSKFMINLDILEVKWKFKENELKVEKWVGYGIRIIGVEFVIWFCFLRYLLVEFISLFIIEIEINFFGEVNLEMME